VNVRAAIAAGGAVLSGVAACGGSSAATPAPGSGPVQHPSALVGTVGRHDAFSIALTDPQGNAITHLAAGTYRLTVHDESTIHDFHLHGPGVDDATQVGETGDKTFTVTFKPGTYTFVCDPHAGRMNGSFRVS
jgi:plastocyanin